MIHGRLAQTLDVSIAIILSMATTVSIARVITAIVSMARVITAIVSIVTVSIVIIASIAIVSIAIARAASMGHGYSGDVNPLVLTVAGHRRVRWRRAARAPDSHQQLGYN